VFGLTVQAGGKVMPIIGVRTRGGFGGGSFAGFPMRCRRYKGVDNGRAPVSSCRRPPIAHKTRGIDDNRFSCGKSPEMLLHQRFPRY